MGNTMNEEIKTDKNTEVVYKLNKLTADNKIRWRFDEEDPILKDDEDNFDLSYITNYKDKLLRLSSKTEKSYRTQLLLFGPKKPRPKLVYVKRVYLEMITDNYKSIYKFDASNESLEDLLETVKIQSSGALDLIDDILSSE